MLQYKDEHAPDNGRVPSVLMDTCRLKRMPEVGRSELSDSHGNGSDLATWEVQTPIKTVPGNRNQLTLAMPPKKRAKLSKAAPTTSTATHGITRFDLPVVKWRFTEESWSHFAGTKIFYSPPELIAYPLAEGGRETWLRAAARRNDEFLGYVYIPPRYGSVWRRLIYAALWWEQIYVAWDGYPNPADGSKGAAAKRLAIEEGSNNAGTRLLQHLTCRQAILEELQKAVLFSRPTTAPMPLLFEYGVRDFRDWFDRTFEWAKANEPEYLDLDPTDPDNWEALSKSTPVAGFVPPKSHTIIVRKRPRRGPYTYGAPERRHLVGG